MIISDHVEQVLKDTLQNNVQFIPNGKIIREGTMVIYTVKDYYITFNFINTKGQEKHYEVPVPFDIVKNKNEIVMSYEVHHATKNDFNCNWLVKQLVTKLKKKSKLMNNKLVVKCETLG